jgi:hypothetical protein
VPYSQCGVTRSNLWMRWSKSRGARFRRQVKTRTLHTPKGSAPREFQACFERTPVPRGWIRHPSMGVKIEKKDQEPSQNPNPSHAEGFGTPRVSIVLEADSGAARMDLPPAHPREFQACFERTPVPRGWIRHPPELRPCFKQTPVPRRKVGHPPSSKVWCRAEGLSTRLSESPAYYAPR